MSASHSSFETSPFGSGVNSPRSPRDEADENGRERNETWDMADIETPRTPETPDVCGLAKTPSESDPLIQKMRVIEPTMELRHVRTQRSIASLLLGKGTTIEKSLFYFAVKTRCLYALWLMWWIGCVLGMLALARVLSPAFNFAPLLMIPLPVIAFFVLSKDLVAEILMELEYYVVNLLSIVVFACAVCLLKDQRCIFWLCMMPTRFITTLIDAYPAKFREFFSKLFFTTQVTYLVAWNVLLMTGWCAWEPTHYQVGKIQGNLAGCTFTTSITLLIFFARHLKVVFYAPDEFVVIKSTVRTFKERLRMSIDGDLTQGAGKIAFVRQKQGETRSKARTSEVAEARRLASSAQRKRILAQTQAAEKGEGEDLERNPETPEATHPAPDVEVGCRPSSLEQFQAHLSAVQEVNSTMTDTSSTGSPRAKATSPTSSSTSGRGKGVRLTVPPVQGMKKSD